MTIQILSDRHTLAAHEPNEREILLRITAPKASEDAVATPLQMSFALDCSGSMAGGRIQLSRLAVLKAINLMGPEDSAALTVFAHSARTIKGLTRLDEEGRMNLRNGLRQTNPDGSTNLFDGWQSAARTLHDCKDIARVLLLSDGHANTGLVDSRQIRAFVAKAASRGIRTSVLGVGDNYDDDLLQSISAAGQGNFYYAESEQQIPEFVAQEVNESRQIVARDIAVTVQLPNGAVMEVLGDWPTSSDGGKVIHLPDLVSEQIVEVGIVLRFSALADGERVRVGFKTISHDGWMPSAELLYDVGDADNQPLNDELAVAMANLRVQEGTREAVRRHRRGEREIAAKIFDDLELVLFRKGISPEKHPELFDHLRLQGERMRHDIEESARKEMTHTSTMGLRTRSTDSKPRLLEDEWPFS